MSGVVDPRKRSREEDVNEFMPLSKRINNLHLNNNQAAGGFPGEHHPVGPVGSHMPLLEGYQVSFPVQCSSSSNSSGSTCHSIPSSGGSSPCGSTATTSASSSSSHGGHQDALMVNGELLGDYCPDLTEHENPHYFNRNKMLYELYVERMRRLQ